MTEKEDKAKYRHICKIYCMQQRGRGIGKKFLLGIYIGLAFKR
jgi:hypothetical protein